ncbi:hypothetical protein GIB67_023902 [Kingdonia uniflora]|uniref:Uncharacterized protein n=1 Tax=Kingdonia uniflora TaxID=39325 RepID=A0A7J7NGT8_9MAGN|nr:hypothetical protein GIB67_023902 [Kingdonia uniflora]
MQPTISVRYLFTNNAHLIWESLRKVYSQRENNARIFQLSNEIGNFKHASTPSEKVLIPPTAAEIYAKIVEKTRVFQFLAELNPDFECARVHRIDRTHFPTLEEAHAYCLSDQSRRSPMPPISGIHSKTSAMAVRYAYPAPPSIPSQTSHTSSPSLSPLPVASDCKLKKLDWLGLFSCPLQTGLGSRISPSRLSGDPWIPSEEPLLSTCAQGVERRWGQKGSLSDRSFRSLSWLAG